MYCKVPFTQEWLAMLASWLQWLGHPAPLISPGLGLQHDGHQVIPSIPVLVETSPISPLSPSLDPELGREVRQLPKLSTVKFSPQQTP